MKNKKETGITLVALVVTIVILLILAGITISSLTGSGLFEKAKLAEEKTKESQEKEDETLRDYQNKIGEYIDGNRENGTKDFAISTPYIGTSAVTIKIDTNTIKDNIKHYVYIVGEEVLKSEETEVTIENLPADSNLDITVIAVTEGYKHLISSNTIKTEPRIYLYNNGDQCTSLTGGWNAEANGFVDADDALPTLTFNRDNMQIYLNSTSVYQGGIVFINNKIDYSNYKKIGISFTASLGRYNSATIISLMANRETENKNVIERLCYQKAITEKTTQRINIFQVENLNDFYFYIQSAKNDGAANCNIYEIWLEK